MWVVAVDSKPRGRLVSEFEELGSLTSNVLRCSIEKDGRVGDLLRMDLFQLRSFVPWLKRNFCRYHHMLAQLNATN